MIELRTKEQADHEAIREVITVAFGRSDEADLVDALRDSGAMFVSLAAVRAGRIVGHIAFSPVTIDTWDGAPVFAMGLAPMAVLPEYQRTGIGSALVKAGLEACRQQGVRAVVVLGHSEYYPKFGFRPATDAGLKSEYDVPPEVFMMLELQPRALSGVSGLVRYHAAFGNV